MTIKLLTSGGLGDALMSLGKIYSNSAPFSSEDIFVHHVRMRDDNFSNVIQEFYNLQGINSKVSCIANCNTGQDMLDWKKTNRHNYDFFLGSGWSANNTADEMSWEINPFPPIKFTHKKNVDIVLNPISGNSGTRKFNKKEINVLTNLSSKITVIGKTSNQNYINYIDSLDVNNLLNKTSLQQVIDVICSAKLVISPEGFVPYLASMSNVKVFVDDQNIKAIEKRKHPKWKMKIIKQLSEVNYD